MAKRRRPVALWPGVISPVSCDYICSHGISPGIIQLTCNEQDKAPAMFGDLVMMDGVTKLVIPDCKLHNVTSTIDEGGRRHQLTIFDRRWRWQELGMIRGAYNQPDPIGIYYPHTLRTPQQLVELCLRALGETNYRVQVPIVTNDLFAQPVNWDYDRPAQALQSLCDSLGCRVVYHVGSNRIWVVPAGSGTKLPNAGSIANDSPSLGIPERPDKIILVGKPIRFQLRLKFQAVGKDWDGMWRPIDNLSYKPTVITNAAYPWGGGSFVAINSTDRLSKDDAQKLAQDTVFKCYQLVNVDLVGGVGIEVPGVGKLLRREQVVMEDTKVEQIQPEFLDLQDGFVLPVDQFGQPIKRLFYDGFRRDQPMMAYGSHFTGAMGLSRGAQGWLTWATGVGSSLNTAYNRRIMTDFSIIDPDWQVIQFAEPVFYFDTANQRHLPCNFFVETACQIRDSETNQIIRYTREYEFPGPKFGTPPLYIMHDDVAGNIIGSYTMFDRSADPQSNTMGFLVGVLDIGDDLGYPIEETYARADYYLRGAAAKWQLLMSHMRQWNGLEPVFCDGAIQQVSYHVGEPKATTTASWNSEHSPYVPPYPARLRWEGLPSPMRREGKKDDGSQFRPDYKA